MSGVGSPDLMAPHSDEILEGRIEQQALDALSSRRLVKDVATIQRQGNACILEKENKITNSYDQDFNHEKKANKFYKMDLDVMLKGHINFNTTHHSCLIRGAKHKLDHRVNGVKLEDV